MTSADNMRRMSGFMFFDISKKDQPALPQEYVDDHSGRVNKDHTVMTFLGPMAECIEHGSDGDTLYSLFDDQGNLRKDDQKGMSDFLYSQRVVVNRTVLIRLLENMTSDWVMFKASEDNPLKVIGEIGEIPCAAYIAPRIE